MTNWLSAVVILGAGVILGFIFVYFVRRKPIENDELTGLQARRDELVKKLREVDIVAEERTRLEIETAQVLRQIDSIERQAPVAGGRGRPLLHDRVIGFIWGAGSMLLLGGLAYFVMQSAKPRETAPAETTMQAARPPADPAVQQLEAAVQRSPDDLDMRVALAKAYLERDNLMGVFDQTQYVLAKSPNDSRALTYQALVRMAMGQSADAISMLEKATKSDPKLIEAWVGLAWAKMQAGKSKEAEAAITEAAHQHPEEKQRLEQVFAQMKQQASGRQATAPVAAREAVVHVTLEVDPAKARNGTVFVIARAEGVQAGPPIAVKRLSAVLLPTTIALTSADSMMGQPLPPKMRIEARVDSDGNPLTRDPADPSAVMDGVTLGSAIRLVLK
ncbi:MAG TPA: tetratricopeptide repeat protein [Thermoanaerobaculia bacterium]